MGRLFGTDGARGVVGTELTAALALDIGRAAAMVLAGETKHKPLVVIGMDTRVSGSMLEAAVMAGLCSVGADVLRLGVVPTPAVAYLVQEYHADAGVMLSASHNPYEFNGIKLFGGDGYKLTDAIEAEMEAIILDHAIPYAAKTGGELGKIREATDALSRYVAHLAKQYRGGFAGRVLVDCANGSAAATARSLFDAMGVDAEIIHDAPNGVNINDRCGSTHIETMAAMVVAGGYDAGLSFDGDADRLLAVDEAGKILDGDFLLAILGEYLRQEGKLSHDTIVVTSMSNLGFFQLMERRKISAPATKVGDRYVLEEMLAHGYALGGEQSGHMIFLDLATTGDGQLSAVMLLNAIAAAKQPLSVLGNAMHRFPQTMKNITATPATKASYAADAPFQAVTKRWETALAGRGRVLIRPSGTEPYIRVMVEGENLAEIEAAAAEIGATITAVNDKQ